MQAALQQGETLQINIRGRAGALLQSSGMHSIIYLKCFSRQAILEVLIRQSNRFSANHLIKIHDVNVKAGYFKAGSELRNWSAIILKNCVESSEFWKCKISTR